MFNMIGCFVFTITYGAIAIALLFLLKVGLSSEILDNNDTENLWQDYAFSKNDMKL